jgi:RecB family exonuclease
VHSLEQSYSVAYKGFILEGNIDRVDIKDNRYTVIDYKSGKIPKSTIRTLEKETNFQLEFYYLLTKDEKEVDGLYYYDLKNAELVRESLFEEKLEKLDEILKELEKPIVDFEKCESTAPCLYCPYVKLCGREV